MRKIIIAIIISCSIAILFNNQFTYVKENSVKVSFDYRCEKDINFQIFYLADEDEYFSEKKSVRGELKSALDFQSASFELGKINSLWIIRFDFGEYPGKFELKNVEIDSGKIDKWDNDALNQLSYYNINNNSIEGNLLSINSNQLDPYIIMNNGINYINQHREKNIKWFQLIFFLIISTSLISKVLYFWEETLDGNKLNDFDYVFLVVVICLIFIPITRIDSNEVSLEENRKMALMPQFFNEDKINLNYGTEFESWFNDHFRFRKELKILYKLIDVSLVGGYENEKAFMGKEKWLFYKGNNSIKNYQNIRMYSDVELKKMGDTLKEFVQMCRNNDIEFYFFIAPDKHRVYGEYYPNGIKKATINSSTKQLINYLTDQTGIDVIYPLDKMLEEKTASDLLYTKIDTHWNSKGAFLGYEMIMDEVEKNNPLISRLEPSEYEVVYEGTDLRDLAIMLDVDMKEYENDMYPHIKIFSESPFDYIKNEGVNGVITSGGYEMKKLLMFRDSFSSALVPFMSYTFNEAEYIWDHNLYKYEEKILIDKPDIVILEIVERSLDELLYFN